MNAELNSAVRSRTSTRVCWSDFWRSGREPPRLRRVRGNKSGERDPRQQHYACARRCATDVRGHVRRIRTHPLSPRANAPNFDSAPIRFDDILSAMFDRPLARDRIADPRHERRLLVTTALGSDETDPIARPVNIVEAQMAHFA